MKDPIETARLIAEVGEEIGTPVVNFVDASCERVAHERRINHAQACAAVTHGVMTALYAYYRACGLPGEMFIPTAIALVDEMNKSLDGKETIQ